MKKIIHFHPDWLYANRFLSPLMQAEKQLGYDTKLVTAKNTPKNDLHIDFDILKKFFKFPIAIFKLTQFIYINKPDIVYCHNTVSSFLPLLCGRILFIKKVIYFNHGVPFIGHQGALKYLLYWLEKINCLLGTNIITVSEEMRTVLATISKKKIEIINKGSACGIQYTNFQSEKKHSIKLKKKIKIGIKDRVFLYIGRANKRKGFYDVIEIWETYFKKNKNFKLFLLGIDSLDFKKNNKTIPENAFPISFVKDINTYHYIADYFFMTSHHEGLSYSVLESFNYKTLVLSNNIPGVSELVVHRKTGFLIDNNCAKNYYDTVMECEKNIKLRGKIIKNAYKVVKKYDRGQFIKYYKNFIEKL